MTKPFKTQDLLRRIDRFEIAVDEQAFKGTYPTEEWDKIERKYKRARLALIDYVIEHAICSDD